MTQYEFVFGFFSMLVALMFGRVVNTFSQLDRKSADVDHAGWLFAMTLGLVLAYWNYWTEDQELSGFLEYIAVLIPGAFVVYVISLLTPSGKVENWGDHFRSVRQRFFIAYSLVWISDMAFDWLTDQDFLFNIVPISIGLIGAIWNNNIVHRVLLAILIGLMVLAVIGQLS